MTKRTKIPRICLRVTVLILALCLGCFLYIQDYYRADTEAIAAFSGHFSCCTQTPRNGVTIYAPEAPETGLIFYPGGKVEYTAYEPLMLACAENGILCILLEMPGNLAVLDVNAADDILQQYPEIENWYIGGHSLGGSMAASYASSHASELDGLILLAAYSTADLSDTSLAQLSIYGSEDQVLNRDKYRKYRENLSENVTEIILDGGCHAYFGMYGSQNGDGVPSISNEDQIRITADAIAAFILQQTKTHP